jgi:hypothetical protein
MKCEFSSNNPPNKEIKDILNNSKTIAIVGLSTDDSKASFKVAEYLQNHGYKIVPVNPKYLEVLGEKCYPDLKSIPEKIDIVDIFRNPDAVPAIVDDAIEIGVKVVWMQLGICLDKSAEKAVKAGLKVVMNKCIKIEHADLG